MTSGSRRGNQGVMVLVLAMGLIASMLFLAPDVYARHLSNNQRYNDGLKDGTNAAIMDRQNGNQFNPACDPTGAHTSDGQHTTIYCSGWSDGYTSVWSSGGQTAIQNQQQDQRQSQTVHTCIALKCEIIQRGGQGQDQQSNQGSTNGG
jgi:hypothetical protein